MKERILRVAVLCCALSLAAASAEAQEKRVQATARLNLRSCPTCPPVGTLEAGTEMQVTIDNGDWLKVQVLPEGETGWVSAGYVTVLAPPVDSQLKVEQSLLHDRFSTAFIWLGIAGFVLSAIAWAKSRKREPRSTLAALLFDPKIVMSWFVLLELGILGILWNTSGLFEPKGPLQLKDYLGMAAPFGYSGWALFWGLPPIRRLVRKAIPWLISWFSFGAGALLLLVPFLIALAFVYSFFGGGLIHFALHCWKVVTATSPEAPAQAAAAAPRGEEPKKGTDVAREEPVQEARPLGNPWQREHPEW